MKMLLLVLFVFLFVSSILISLVTFEVQVGQGCGTPGRTTSNTYLITDYYPAASSNDGFIDCIGPSSFLLYRPLDLSAVALVISLVMGAFAIKKY